ncbi:MAG: DUF5666 domain-containing protein [Thermomicrobiales bacterium]
MRRRGVTVIIIALLAVAFVGTWSLAYRAGESKGRDKISTDRSAFQTRVASAPQTGASGSAQAGGGRGGGGNPAGAGTGGNTTGTNVPGGSAVTGGGGAGQRGSATGGAGASGTAASGGAASAVTGKVTKVDTATISLQQTDNSTISVTTNASTAVRKLVAGALTDLKAGDIVTVDGSKTGDTAFSAKTVTGLGSAPGAGGADGGTGGGRGQAAPPTGGTPPAVTGQIKSIDGGTITVQGFDGSSVTVTTTPTTIVRTQQAGTMADIKTGDVLVILGDKIGDTTFLARTITNQGATGG